MHLLQIGIEFLIVVWKTEGPRVNFVIRIALFEINTWILCLSEQYEKQTSRIQSLYLYFIESVRFLASKNPF